MVRLHGARRGAGDVDSAAAGALGGQRSGPAAHARRRRHEGTGHLEHAG